MIVARGTGCMSFLQEWNQDKPLIFERMVKWDAQYVMQMDSCKMKASNMDIEK